MSKTKQRFNTAYQQGMADGRLGLPFRYTKPPKPLRGRVPRCLVWYHPAYAAGYRAGRLTTRRYQLEWAKIPSWLGKALIGFIGGLATITFYALITK